MFQDGQILVDPVCSAWLEVVTNCDTVPKLLPSILHRAKLPCDEVMSVQHYAITLKDLWDSPAAGGTP